MSPSAERPSLTIYSDGGCDPNPGPGGWAAILSCGDQVLELSGHEAHTTNNRMELAAAIQGLATLKRPCTVTIFTDSQYLRQGITTWVKSWQRNGWRTRNGQPVENQDLWEELLAQVARHDVTWRWVRGHQGDPLNERADALARRARTGAAAPSHHAASSSPEAAATALPEVALYCRGACQGNPGPGGYAAVIAPAQGEPHVISGGWPNATNNAMELWAVIAGLRSLQQVSRVHVYTTSRYVLDGATRWLAEWEQNGWRTRDGREVQNAALWQELAHVMGDHDLTWHHVPAAQPNRLLRRAARAAQDAASRQRKDSG